MAYLRVGQLACFARLIEIVGSRPDFLLTLAPEDMETFLQAKRWAGELKLKQEKESEKASAIMRERRRTNRRYGRPLGSYKDEREWMNTPSDPQGPTP